MTVVQSAVVLPERAPSLAHDASRIPALDGLRGLAVMAVMLHHFSEVQPETSLVSLLQPIAHFGWCGVDLFFVLSGFLITGILCDARNSDHYFRNFYVRRTVRIFPLYYAVLIAALLVLPHFGITREKFGTTREPAWYWLYLSNFDMALRGYQNKILGVSWSLAIEEQFYLVWPTVVFFCGRRTLIRLCVWLIGLSIICRFGLGIYEATGGKFFNENAAYWLTFCRMDAICLGSLLALLQRARGIEWLLPRARIAMFGAIAIMLALWMANGPIKPWIQTGLDFTFVAMVAGGLLVTALAARKGTIVGQLFSSRVLRVFGKYSYALYLFHFPVAIVLGGIFRPERFPVLSHSYAGQAMFYVLATAGSLGVALLSWNIYEKQFLKLKNYFPMGEAKAGALATGN